MSFLAESGGFESGGCVHASVGWSSVEAGIFLVASSIPAVHRVV